jgi:hypothetical protein
MHEWMEQDDKRHGWRHISRIRLEQDHAHRQRRLRGVAQQPAGPIAGVSEYVASIIYTARMKLCELPHRYTSSGVT